MKSLSSQINTVICGDVLKTIRTFPTACIDCVITSPPYWQLRDYGWSGQWGLEKTYNEYLNHLFEFMDELKRILKPEGTVWINLGDTYFGSGNDSGKKEFSQSIRKVKAGTVAPSKANTDPENNLKKKCQVLIPHRFAVGCVDRGWILRNDIIWAKPNGLPESVQDRFSKKHEHIFLLVKNQDYFFDLDSVREKHKEASIDRVKYKMTAYAGDAKNKKGAFGKGGKNGGKLKKIKLNPLGKNPGDVTDFWCISTKPGSDKHYATFNSELITKPILAGCPESGIILDPFCGTATTGIRAIELKRNFIGIEGKKEYCTIGNRNLQSVLKNKKVEIKSLVKELKNLSFAKAA
jgi:DNA modification methylase